MNSRTDKETPQRLAAGIGAAESAVPNREVDTDDIAKGTRAEGSRNARRPKRPPPASMGVLRQEIAATATPPLRAKLIRASIQGSGLKRALKGTRFRLPAGFADGRPKRTQAESLAHTGRRLRAVRERRGLTQQAAAEAVGIRLDVMVSLEEGGQAGSLLEVCKLVDLYGCDGIDLLEDSAAFVLDDLYDVLLRKFPEMGGGNKEGIGLMRLLSLCREGMALRRFLGQISQPEVPDYSALPASAAEAVWQGEKVARFERERTGLGRAPIRDVTLPIGAGIWLAKTDLPDGVSGLCVTQPDIGTLVAISNELSGEHERFAFSHGYAHALFDRSDVVTIDRANDALTLAEIRANSFAESFLLPADGVAAHLDQVGKGRAGKRERMIFGLGKGLPTRRTVRELPGSQTVTFQDAAELARQFGTGYKEAVCRLRNLGHVSAREYETLIDKESMAEEHIALLFRLDSPAGPPGSGGRHNEIRRQIARLSIEACRREAISGGRHRDITRSLTTDLDDCQELWEAPYKA